MSFSYVVSIWNDESPGPGRSSADVTVPLTILVPAGTFPALVSIIPDMLSSYGLASAQLVRFVDSVGVISDYWYQKVPV